MNNLTRKCMFYAPENQQGSFPTPLYLLFLDLNYPDADSMLLNS